MDEEIKGLKIETLPKGVIYELWELDSFYHILEKKVGTEVLLSEARSMAKELALAWCNNESELHKIDGKDKELWIGESDFGILIKKGKV